MINAQIPPPGFFPRTWLGRLLSALVTLALVVAGVFFLAFALAVAAVIATLVLARFWWISRKLRKRRNADVIEGSYTVEVDTPRIADRDEPPRP